MRMRGRNAFWPLAIVLAFCTPVPAHADNSGLEPYEEFGKHIRAAQEVTPEKSDVFGDQVSLYNGATEFDVTDFSIPGNDALPVAIGRRFTVDDRRKDPGYLSGFGDWDIEVPYVEAVVTTQNGWTLYGSTPSNRCSDTTDQLNTKVSSSVGLIPAPLEKVWDGNQLHIPGAGSQELLVNDQGKSPAYASRGTYKWVTKDNWKLSCIPTVSGMSGEGFVAVSPSGVTYTFNRALINTAPQILVETVTYNGSPVKIYADRLRIFLLATQVKDRFGNTVNYNYDASNHLTSITSSDGRSITLTWSGSNIASVSSALGTWTYGYGTDSSGRTVLTSVTRPDGSKWTYTIASGALETFKPLEAPCGRDVPCPPPQHCQLTPYENTGSFTYVIGAPSGATATYAFDYLRYYRIGVPRSCPDGTTDHAYPQVYTFFDNFSLVSKQIRGPGLPAISWSYVTGGVPNDESGAAPGYFDATAPYDPNAEVYLPDGSCGSEGPGRTVTVTGPTNVIKYTFGNTYGCDEGRLYDTEIDVRNADGSAGPTLKTTTSAFVEESAASGEPFPTVAGSEQLANYVHPIGNRVRPVTSTQIVQDGASFTTDINSFDAFARVTSETGHNTTGGWTRTTATSYYDNTYFWVLGQIANRTVNGTVTEQSDFYGGNALPGHHWVFGKLQSYSEWNADGTLSAVLDGSNHTTTLSNWFRGIPRSVKYADGTTQSAVVNDAGWITSVTDENGYTTGYKYDPMGRLSEIDYPTSDDVAWNVTTRAFQQIAGSEYGIPAGHWRQIVQTGNGRTVTYFDALWRPLVVDSYDLANIAGTRSVSAESYDADGRKIFASFAASSGSDPAFSKGTHTSYDALGRVTELDQDSELGTLKTKMAYLSGFRTQVTNPRGYATTTSYVTFGEPDTSYPFSIIAPEGETTYISRDVFDKPLKIIRTGPYNGGTLTMTRYYVYDANQQLCKRIDPESGATAFGYDLAGNLQWSAAGLSLPNTTTCDTDTAYNSGRRVDRGYDARNRLVALAFPDGNGDQTWSYTPDGLPSKVTTDNGGANTSVTNTYFYDRRRLLTLEWQSAYYDNGPYTWSARYSYDANGHRSGFADPTTVSYSYAPNALGQPTELLGSNGTTYASGVSYFPDGKLKGYTAGNGIVYTMQENTRDLPSRITDSGAQNQPATMDSLYTYDEDGDVTAINDVARTNFDRTMTYDGLDRLTGFNSGAVTFGGQYNFSYDPLDNLRSYVHVGGSTSTYNYDGSNRLTSIVNSANGTTTLIWDAQGNLASKNGQAYTFDYGNRLRSMAGQDDYRYDAWGRRQRADSASLGEILWMYGKDGKPVFMANRQIGGTQYTYLYLGDHLVATQMNVGSTHPVYWHTTDALGSEVAHTNSDAWADHFNYFQPWGGLQSGSLDDGPGYAGQINDTNTGLSYADQRYYDPHIPRFISMDPVGVDTTTGSNFNRYWYANDNPYRYTDPDGRCTGSHTSFCPSATKIIQVAEHWGEQKLTQAASRAAHAVVTTAKQYAQDARNFVSQRDVTVTIGVSGIAGTPLKGNSVSSPGVTLLGDAGVTFDLSSGQVALQGSFGAAASAGGGVAGSGNFAIGLNDGPLKTGFGQANTAFGQISAVPETGVPVELGSAVQWSRGASSVSIGVKPGVGTYIGAGVGRVFTGTVATPPAFERNDGNNQ